ncbi:hypothetical protein DFH08DRAFT_902705, partial [Mycena albidolilacea]
VTCHICLSLLFRHYTLASHPQVPCSCLHHGCFLGLGISLAQPVHCSSPAGPMPLHSSKPSKLGAWGRAGKCVEGSSWVNWRSTGYI